MSIFGQLDAANIPTNPFFIEAGDYEAEVTKALFKNNRDGQKQLVIEYTITDDASEFDGKTVSQYFTLVDPDMTAEQFALLPAAEKQKISRTNSAIKRTLCGNNANEAQKGLGVDPEDLNSPTWTPEFLVGTKVNIGISNYGAENEGVNLKWVNLRD